MKVQAYFNSFFWLTATYLLAPLFYFLIFFRKQNERPKILVIQTAKIGDLVCTTPVFREIKKNFPDCYLTAMVLAQTKDVLSNNPRIDEIIVINDYSGIQGGLRLIKKLRRDHYDWVFGLFPDYFINVLGFWSLAKNRATTTHKHFGETIGLLSIFNNYHLEYKTHTSRIKHYLSLLKFIGIDNYSERKEIFIQPNERKKASDFLKNKNLSPNDLSIGVCVAAGVKFKQWEPAKFAVLADLLTARLKAKIIFIGSLDDRVAIGKIQEMMQNSSVNTAGYFNLRELPALMENLKLFISGDTGPLYIADALNILSIDIPGPVDIYEQSPIHERCAIVQKELYCCPCLFSPSFASFCKEGGHLKCLKQITPEDVFSAAVSLLNKNINNQQI